MCRAIGIVCVLVVTATGTALAQRDISGNWTALYHEDQPHRIPGPDLGDYTGIPLNDAGRHSSVVTNEAGLPVVAYFGFEEVSEEGEVVAPRPV